MNLVIELDRSRILGAGAQNRKLRMRAIERANIAGKTRGAVLIVGGQVRVALRASFVACIRQPHGTFMLDMAGGARRRKGLLGVMDWPIVTSHARLVGGALLESGRRDMAGAAFLPE